jgi:hypothetical protein
MSRTFRKGDRHIRARGIRQDPPDLRRIARALIALAEAQAEAEAQALVENPDRPSRPKPGSIVAPKSARSSGKGSKEVA